LLRLPVFGDQGFYGGEISYLAGVEADIFF
jgi:hypothetical protein